jgi:predicted ATP-dependent serine protease
VALIHSTATDLHEANIFPCTECGKLSCEHYTEAGEKVNGTAATKARTKGKLIEFPKKIAEPEATRKILLTAASEIEPEPVVWAWTDSDAGRVPGGSMGLAAGREGTGKSSFAIWMTARITTGTLPGMLSGKPGSVIYAAVEDSWKYTIVPRLIAAGADLSRVFRIEVEAITGDLVSLCLPTDNRLLEQAITDNGVAMVVVDPLLSALSSGLDSHVNHQVRQALEPLAATADRTGAVILGIAHFNKSGGSDASNLITASGAFKDVARFVAGAGQRAHVPERGRMPDPGHRVHRSQRGCISGELQFRELPHRGRAAYSRRARRHDLQPGRLVCFRRRQDPAH